LSVHSCRTNDQQQAGLVPGKKQDNHKNAEWL